MNATSHGNKHPTSTHHIVSTVGCKSAHQVDANPNPVGNHRSRVGLTTAYPGRGPTRRQRVLVGLGVRDEITVCGQHPGESASPPAAARSVAIRNSTVAA